MLVLLVRVSLRVVAWARSVVCVGAGVARGRCLLVSVAFFLFLFASRKTKVSDREFDSRGRHSACETVIAVHMVK